MCRKKRNEWNDVNVDVSAYLLSTRLKLEVEVIKVKNVVPVDLEILAHNS